MDEYVSHRIGKKIWTDPQTFPAIFARNRWLNPIS
jgi:hypothetical protein